MRILLALLALSLAAPLASADPFVCMPVLVGFACGGEGAASQGSCDTAGYAYGYETLFVFSPAILIVYAGHSCYAGPGLEQETTSISADVFTPVAAVQFQWADVHQESTSGTYDACTMQLVVGTLAGWHTLARPCPQDLAPPNPGWGNILP